MGRPARGIAAGLAGLAGVLFAGHWIAGFLAERWWTAEVAPGAMALVTTGRLIALGLEAGAVILAATWFAAHFILVARAIGSIQFPRRFGDLEIREAIAPAVVTTSAIALALLLGVLVGAGTGHWAPAVALAWHGVHFGLTDPILNHDAGLYVAQLPVWLGALGFLRTLVVVALAGVALLYFALGAIRIGPGGLALSDHARIHLGLLGAGVIALAGLATALAPLRAVGGMGGAELPNPFQADMDGVIGVILGSAAVLMVIWAFRGRGALLIAGLIAAMLALATLLVLPAVGLPGATTDAVRTFTVAAWGLGGLEDRAAEAAAGPLAAPTSDGIWPAAVLVPAAQLSGGRVIAADQVRLPVGGVPRPAWLLVRAAGDSAVISAVADDRVNAAGGPLAFRPGDTLEYPGLPSFLSLGSAAVRPEAPAYRLNRSVGVPLAGALRRLVLAWAVQVGAVLTASADSLCLIWRLDPAERVTALLPGAVWRNAGPMLLADGPGWIVDGFVPFAAFPLVPRREWAGDLVNGVDPGFVAFVTAESGRVRIFLRPGAGPVARAWAELSRGLVEPDSALPAVMRDALTYPAAWLALQSQVLLDGPFGLPSRRGMADSEAPPPVAVGWDGAFRPVPSVVVTAPDASERVVALIRGAVHGGRLAPELLRLPPSASLPGPRRLGRSWDRFASFGQLADSIVATGGELIAGPVHYQMAGQRLVAVGIQFRKPPRGAATLAWVSVAVGDRVGAGRDLAEAWANLLGRTVPIVADPRSGDRLAQIRAWIVRADSALRRGDLAAFGRAFDALKELAGTP